LGQWARATAVGAPDRGLKVVAFEGYTRLAVETQSGLKLVTLA